MRLPTVLEKQKPTVMDFVTDAYKILCSCNCDYEDYLSSEM